MNLRPYGAESAAVLAKLPLTKMLKVSVVQPRNLRHHRLYFTLCHRIGDALGIEAEDISDVLKLRTGHVREIKTKHGIERIPKSISFAAMDQDQFKAFFDKAVTIITAEWGVAREDILECVKDLLEEKAPA